MGMKEKAALLFEKTGRLRRGEAPAGSKLPENTWFLDDSAIACFPRKRGDSRYFYGTDGFYLWAYQSGYISVNESTFTVFPYADEGKQPYLAFFGGIKDAKGGYLPVSLTGVAAQPRERAERCTVFTPTAAYYLTETEGLRFAVRIYADEKKRVRATLSAQNLTGTDKEIYLSSYLNCLLRYMPVEDIESKWYKRCGVRENGFLIESVVDLSREEHVNFYAVVRRRTKGDVSGISATSARADFCGGKTVSLNCAEPLFTGSFAEEKKTCGFSDTAVAGEIIRFRLPANGYCEEDLSFEIYRDPSEAERSLSLPIGESEFDDYVAAAEKKDEEKFVSDRMLKIAFGPFSDKRIDADVLNRFIGSVIRQVESCALAKTSSLSMLGVRDVFQQIEAALIWNPADCRRKILEALDFIGTDGRAPRQYSLPARRGSVPVLDLREFIDQGVWIVDALYTYLAYTGDDSVLREECGYYVYRGREASLTDERDSVLDHLVRIVGYLLANVDDKTHCLRILYGDWNDALDGLGTTEDKDKQFGSGVSVMATLQLCRNLEEMSEILRVRSLRPDLVSLYEKKYGEIKEGLQRYAVHKNQSGERRIVHGWGDKMEYFVGSFQDVDGKSRDGLTANAFWVLSGAYEWDKSIRKEILASYDRLDSKYGLKTFEPPFARGTRGVGRIPNLPAGTAENGASYAHATLFGIWSLFKMGEGERAWEQLVKVLPPAHEFISTSPFVMSNSYIYNEELGVDGESMNDWYTGSAAVLIKALTRCVFGVEVTQTRLKISPSAYFPCDQAEMSFMVRGVPVRVKYRKGSGVRSVIVNGKRTDGPDGYETALADLKGPLEVEVEG